MENKNKTGINLSKIKGLRVEHGFTQKSMASELGMADRTYYCKENGLNEFTVNELVKLADIFGVKIKDLFF